jgi:hypothetical protein
MGKLPFPLIYKEKSGTEIRSLKSGICNLKS